MTDVMTLERLRNNIKDAAWELLKAGLGEGITRLVPRFPFCLVYILPRDRMSRSGLILPDYSGPGAAAKITDEGIIMRVWEPGEKRIPVRRGDKEDEIILRTEMKAGDHVLFGHWAGMPIPGDITGDWTSNPFRFVKEYQNAGSSVYNDIGGDTIYAKVDTGINVEQELLGFIESEKVHSCQQLSENITKQFVVYPRSKRQVMQ